MRQAVPYDTRRDLHFVRKAVAQIAFTLAVDDRINRDDERLVTGALGAGDLPLPKRPTIPAIKLEKFYALATLARHLLD